MILCLERNGQLEVIMERCFVQIGQIRSTSQQILGIVAPTVMIYGGGYRAYHVEHFAPKEKFPELRYDYDNLLYACPWCNRAKWDIWPSDNSKINVVDSEGFIDPCTEEYDKHLIRLPDGSISGITPLGKYMRKTLQLYLKRHEIIHNLDKLKRKRDELKNSVAKDKLQGKECRKKEAALQLITESFFEYFNLWEKISQESA